MNRREFLTAGARGALGAGLLVLPRWARGQAPSDLIRVATVGVRGIGNVHINWFRVLSECRIDALCDVDSQVLASRLRRVHSHYGDERARGYGDYRRILDRSDIDAVTVGTPDHWHALIACDAFVAGKDVYGEKPMTWCWQEARAMKTLVERHARVFQLGCQRHALGNMRRCAEILKSGALGRIHTVRCWKGVRTPFYPDGEGDEPSPAHLDYDMWLGPAPLRPYNRHRCHYDFRFFWDYSGGDYVNWWAHVVDLVEWGVGFTPPITVDGRGRDIQRGQAEAMEWIDVDIRFEHFMFHWTTRPPRHPAVVNRDLGMIFEGTRGTLGADFGRRVILVNGERLRDLPDVPSFLPRSPGHQRDFLNCIRSRERPDADMTFSYNLSVPMFLGRVSMQLGRPLRWDAENERCVGDAEANRRLGRVYRGPWVLPT